ncbi:MAG: glucose-6-phosphate isomerase [Chloroflexi bacterium]|nr:glucose-6-phosphate isomerase [Chloroflexota bacterium]
MLSVRQQIASLDSDYLELLGEEQATIERTLSSLSFRGAARALWAKDGSLWSDDAREIGEIVDRLGWLDLPMAMRVEVPRLRALAIELGERRIGHAILLGMGGSSLAPEVLQETFRDTVQGIELIVLDSTDPAQIRRVEESIDLAATVFLASSKSGTTAETRTLLEYFASRLEEAVGGRWMDHIIAISDPGTPLQALADEEGFLARYEASADVGGRYSALTLFGLVPSALIGIDCDRLLQNAAAMTRRCRGTVPEAENPAFRLGAAMAGLAQVGRDKLTILASPRLASFGCWAEQLIAESTGKDGRGILPVEGEPLLDPSQYGSDRAFVYVRLKNDENDAADAFVDAVSSLGHPAIVLQLADRYDLGGEFFRWEMATAVAGAVLGINPFDQPNVEEAKDGARDALAGYEATGSLADATPLIIEDALAIYGQGPAEGGAAALVGRFLRQSQPGDYIALMAYIDRTPEHAALLREMRTLLTAHLGIATTVGFGPRFLHSTGQIHKGGRNNGLFIQITQIDEQDLDIPGKGYSFGVLKSAQAAGDLVALSQRGRRTVRVRVGSNVAAGLSEMLRLLENAVA